MPTCYRHPTRETRVSCSSCGRPICPDCMTSTPVGMRCPECARDRTQVRRLRTSSSRPPVTSALIALNVAAFLAELAGGGTLGSAGSGSVFDHGALYGPLVAEHHDWWRIVTSGFLHAGPTHILFNMWFVWVLGAMLEPAIGSVRFALLYATALLCGSFGVLLLQPESVTVGASGAAFGLLGAAIVELRARGIDIWASGLGFVAVFNFAMTFVLPGISIGAHVGGFLGGMLVGALYREADRRRLPEPLALALCVALALAAFAGAIAVAGSAGLLGNSHTSLL